MGSNLVEWDTSSVAEKIKRILAESRLGRNAELQGDSELGRPGDIFRDADTYRFNTRRPPIKEDPDTTEIRRGKLRW